MSERDWDWTEDLYYEIVRPERPYPEAPLASRKAPDLERDSVRSARVGSTEAHVGLTACADDGASRSKEEFSTRAENQAEALAIERHQERKHGPDFKKPPRYIDPEVLRAFHDTQPDCLTCGYYRVSAHHLVSRAQGGDDVAENLIPLCGMCHGCLHSGGKWQAYGASMTADAVRDGIGRFLTSEAGSDHLQYVKRKLGTGAAAFLSKYGVEDA